LKNPIYAFLRIIDKSQVFYYSPITKQQSSQLKNPSSPTTANKEKQQKMLEE
jgi:hypothetical protein